MTRRAVPVLLLLLAAAGSAIAASHSDDSPKPEREVSCWECHNVAVGGSPPVSTFVDLTLPGARASPVGTPFDYTVQATNRWTAELLDVAVTMDLANAPSFGFATGALPIDETRTGAIALDPARLAEPQRGATEPVEITPGQGRLVATLRPTGGGQTDLALVVQGPDGAEVARVDAAGANAAETLTLGADVLERVGPGDWTFLAEATVLSPERPTVPTGNSIPFEVEVNTEPGSKPLRQATVEAEGSLTAGKSAPITFRLVPLATPGPGETVALTTGAWVHFRHTTQPPDDDDNLTKPHPVPVQAVLLGDLPGLTTPQTQVELPTVHNGPTLVTISEAVGYATALLMTSSVTTGGMFGKASRRGLNHLFGAAKRRVAFHNFLSYGILLAGSIHMALFLLEGTYAWTAGMLWGGLAILALLGLGVTGAVQVPLIRAWGYNAWRWTHYGLAVAALLLTLAHGLLDGAHFTDVQRAIGWNDPLA